MNTSPALYRCCSLLAELLPPVLEEVVQRCVDPYFPPPLGAQLPVRALPFSTHPENPRHDLRISCH